MTIIFIFCVKQNNLFKAREEKYQSRIRVLEALATGTSEETQVLIHLLALIYFKAIKIFPFFTVFFASLHNEIFLFFFFEDCHEPTATN